MPLIWRPDQNPRTSSRFQRMNVGQRMQVWSIWNGNRSRAGLVRVDPPAELVRARGTMKPPPLNNRDTSQGYYTHHSISFDVYRNHQQYYNTVRLIDIPVSAGGEPSQSNRRPAEEPPSETPEPVRQRTDSPQPGPSGLHFPVLGAPSSSSDSDSGSSGEVESQLNTPHVSPINSSGESMASMGTRARGATAATEAMETDMPAQARAGAGHTSSSDGGFDSAQGPISYLDQSMYKAKGGQAVYKKCHFLNTWAIPFTTVTTGSRRMVITPLANVPWDRMFMYMSKEEFDLIPAGSHAVKCHVKITHISTSTAYPTGGS